MPQSANVALITGSARRVGRAVAIELARAGYDVAVHYHRSESDAEKTAADIRDLGRRAALIQADLAVEADWPRIIDEAVRSLGRLDVLVNNASMFDAAVPERIDAPTFDADLWSAMLRVNLTAPVALAHHARRHLSIDGRGRIINFVDIAAERPWSNHLAYCASKAGLVAATRSLARALAPGIQVNAIAPGIAVFPPEYSASLRASLVDKVPLKREGTPEEVARLVGFLVESGDYITGEVIAIDGGRHLV